MKLKRYTPSLPPVHKETGGENQLTQSEKLKEDVYVDVRGEDCFSE